MVDPPKIDGSPAWSPDWEVGVRVWVERQGATVLGTGRCDLLAAIDRTHSITAAAKALGMSYRKAWSLVQEINAAAGEPLVAAAPGGPQGGGARLTPRGQLSLTIFQQLEDRVRAGAVGVLEKVVAPQGQLSATLHLAAAISLEEAVGQVLAEHALKQPALRVRAVFGASNELADHILAGAPCDLFLSADPAHLDRLAAASLLDDGARRVLAANGLSVIAAKSASLSLRRVEDLSSNVEHVAMADPASPLGKWTEQYLKSIGQLQPLVDKAIWVDNSRGILAAVRSGRAEAGIAFSSDAATAADCRTLVEIDPADASLAYEAAVLQHSPRRADAEKVLAFFAGPIAQQCFRRCGLKPVRSDRTAKKR